MEGTPKRPVSRSTRDRFVLSDDISNDAVHSDVDVQRTGSAAVLQVGDTTRTVFVEATSVLHEVLHESDEDGDTDSSMEVEMEVAEEADLQTTKSLLVPHTQSVVLPGNIATGCASETDEGIEERVPLTHFQEVVSKKFPDLAATILFDSNGITLLQITHMLVHNHPPAGYVHRVRVILSPVTNGYHYDLQALLTSVENGVILNDQDFTQVCNKLLQFVFCPGIDYRKYHDDYYSVIRFHCKQVSLSEAPFQRVESKGCLRWHKLPKNATLKEQASSEVLCSLCKRLQRDLEHQKKRSALVSPERKAKRQAANS